jgi:hypothetical protein
MFKGRSKILIPFLTLGIAVYPGVSWSEDANNQIQLSYSAWTKVCVDDPGMDIKGCLTGREARVDGGDRIFDPRRRSSQRLAKCLLFRAKSLLAQDLSD